MRTLYLGGIDNSGPDHWQRRWFDKDPSGVWVEHGDWGRPSAGDWAADMDATAGGESVLVVAHSLGCLLTTEWLRRHPGVARLAGAYLVAPPDPLAEAYPRARVEGFRPGDETVLGCPVVLVASRNDPFGGFEYARRCAAAWSAVFVDAGARGHLNAASGLGDWERARARWKEFLVINRLEQH